MNKYLIVLLLFITTCVNAQKLIHTMDSIHVESFNNKECYIAFRYLLAYTTEHQKDSLIEYISKSFTNDRGLQNIQDAINNSKGVNFQMFIYDELLIIYNSEFDKDAITDEEKKRCIKATVLKNIQTNIKKYERRYD